MKRSLAVIMTVHNRRDTTLECIRRFYACYGIEDFEIEFYMMDDGCTDGTAEAVRASFPWVIILKGNGNLFWNRGMYYCWREAIKKHHDFYLWLNDDTFLFKTALETVFNNYYSVNEPSIISGCCCDTATQSVTTYGGRVGKKTIEANGNVQTIEWMNGNFVLIPHLVIEKIGINDPYFHHSAGDSEYGSRALINGIGLYVTSKFVGTCDRHDVICKSMDARYTLKERLSFLNTPWGTRPRETFYLYRKYKGFWYALYLFIMSYFYCFFPKLNK